MGERVEAGSAAAPKIRRAQRQPVWVTIPVVVALAFAAVAVIVTAVRTFQDDNPEIVLRPDPTADLLAWLPATETNRRVFAVWAGEAAVDGAPPAVFDVRRQDALGLEPAPPILGRSGEWRAAFGWGAGEVTAWAVAGEGGFETTVLAGRFDLEAVRDALDEAGYDVSAYQGGSLYLLHPVATPSATIDGDQVAAANAVGILAGRLIAADDPERVRAAMDAATGQRVSLADDPGVAALLDAVRPSVGLAARDAADVAAVCVSGDALARAPDTTPSGRYAALAHGIATPSGARQSVVAVTFDDAAVAAANASAWSLGWVDAVVSLGEIVSPVSAYGEVTSAGAVGPALIARVVNGRVDGWAPLAARVASPVCAAVADLTPPPPPLPATPEPTAAERRASTAALLPDAGVTGTLLFADLAAVGAARGLVAPTEGPGIAPPADEVAVWWSGLGPLPPWALLPSDPGAMAQIPVVFGIGLDQIEVVAEARNVAPAEMVGVLVGDWDAAVVRQALANAGYDSLPVGEAIVFAVPLDAALPPWAPAAWANVALWGDRLFLSPSGRTLRIALDAAMAGTSAPADSARARLLATAPEATAGIIVGAEAARLDCAARGVTAQTPAWDGIAAFWIAEAGQDRAAIAIDVSDEVAVADARREMEIQIGRARIAAPANVATPGAGRSLDQALGYVETRVIDTRLVVVDFVVPAGTHEIDGFFTAVNFGCSFIARP